MTMDMATATASSAMAAATDDMGDMADMMGGCKISVGHYHPTNFATLANMFFAIDAVELEHHRLL